MAALFIPGTRHVLRYHAQRANAVAGNGNAAVLLKKLDEFAEVLERDQCAHLAKVSLDCAANLKAAKTTVSLGRKYAKVDIGADGRYMVDLVTERIFGTKCYGVPHMGRSFGTLDTVHNYNWGGYRAHPAMAPLINS